MNPQTTEAATQQKEKHTPGPWKICTTKVAANDNGDFWACIGTKHAEGVAFDVMTPAMINTQESIANARLIAAAPELLDALETVRALQYDYSDEVREKVAAVVDAAIAKAEGAQ